MNIVVSTFFVRSRWDSNIQLAHGRETDVGVSWANFHEEGHSKRPMGGAAFVAVLNLVKGDCKLVARCDANAMYAPPRLALGEMQARVTSDGVSV